MAAAVQASTQAANASENLSININKPTGTVDGDLLVAVISLASGDYGPGWDKADWPATTDDADAGSYAFTLLNEQIYGSSTLSGEVAYRNAGASEPSTGYRVHATASSGGDENAIVMLRIDGHTGNPTTTGANGSSTAPDPPNHTGSTGLWLVGISVDSGRTVTTEPTSYTVLQEAVATSQVTTWIGDHDTASQASPQNPGTATITSTPWCAWTINVADGAAAGLSIPVAMQAYRQRHQSVV